MNVNVNWERWIFASVDKFFVARKSTLTYHNENEDYVENVDMIVLRTNGPDWVKLSGEIVGLNYLVNILVVAVKDIDIHKPMRMKGIVAAAFENCIPVYKYGDGGALVGHLTLQGPIRNDDFGQLQPDVPVIQSTIQGNYRFDLV